MLKPRRAGDGEMLWLILIWCSLIVPFAEARTVRVPQDAPTIQAGLDSLQGNDTVLVEIGTYAEALTAPPLHFVLRGVVDPDTGDYPRPTIDPTPLPGADTLTCLTLPEGSHPVVEDLSFRNGLAMYPHSIGDGGITSRAIDPVFRRIVMDSVIYALTNYRVDAVITLDTCQFRHVYQSGVLAPNSTVYATRCLFSQNQAVLLNCGARSVIRDCRFEAAGSPADVMLVIGGTEGGGRVHGCTFESTQSILGSAISAYYGAAGVSLPVEISDNIFADLSGSASPIFVQYNYPDWLSTSIAGNLFVGNRAEAVRHAGAIEFDQVRGFDAGPLADIRDNAIIDCGGLPDGSNAILACAGAEITNNRFVDLPQAGAPAIRMGYDSIESQLMLRGNLFLGTGRALQNDEINTALGAEQNYWGDSTGPFHAQQNRFGHGDTIVGSVDFTPWYPDTSFLLSTPGTGKPLPKEFVLEVYPNPFNSTVHITLIPSEVGIVKVELFDILGRGVEELWHGPLAFRKEISFDASGLPSGLYFARVTDVLSRKNLAVQELVLLK